MAGTGGVDISDALRTYLNELIVKTVTDLKHDLITEMKSTICELSQIIEKRDATINNLEDHVKKVVARNVELADVLANTRDELAATKQSIELNEIKIDDKLVPQRVQKIK